MNTLSATDTVGQIVAKLPQTASEFERLGIDYCCRGRDTLHAACVRAGADATAVLAHLRELERSTEPGGRDWTTARAEELADHIEQTHHARLKRELPRLRTLLATLSRVHGTRHGYLHRLEAVFGRFADDLEAHMHKEEHVLFPVIRAMEHGAAPGILLDAPIDCLTHEHEDAGRALDEMRSLTGGFAIPSDACATFRVTMHALTELERDMHIHVHKENSILFPRAAVLAAERGPARRTSPVLPSQSPASSAHRGAHP